MLVSRSSSILHWLERNENIKFSWDQELSTFESFVNFGHVVLWVFWRVIDIIVAGLRDHPNLLIEAILLSLHVKITNIIGVFLFDELIIRLNDVLAVPVEVSVWNCHVPVNMSSVISSSVLDVDIHLPWVRFAHASRGRTNEFLDDSIPVIVTIGAVWLLGLPPAVFGHLPPLQRIIAAKPIVDSLLVEAHLPMRVFQALFAREIGVVVWLLEIAAHGPDQKDPHQNHFKFVLHF